MTNLNEATERATETREEREQMEAFYYTMANKLEEWTDAAVIAEESGDEAEMDRLNERVAAIQDIAEAAGYRLDYAPWGWFLEKIE